VWPAGQSWCDHPHYPRHSGRVAIHVTLYPTHTQKHPFLCKTSGVREKKSTVKRTSKDLDFINLQSLPKSLFLEDRVSSPNKIMSIHECESNPPSYMQSESVPHPKKTPHEPHYPFPPYICWLFELAGDPFPRPPISSCGSASH
jgi:hypothetical protein